ncbi:cation:proton antiporter [Streptomyces sp. NPDC001843]|uniref:cation:proton antiporter n=1 Tax=Streptomyces sp. NPDC001843 TaxID=3364617 RepID=UPI00367C3E3B
MDVLGLLPRLPHAAAALSVLLAIACAGRAAARLLRQPAVIGEVTLGLLAGPVALGLLGRKTFDALLPGPVLHVVELVAEAGLVFFLVGLVHELRSGPVGPGRRDLTALTAGALVAPLLTGLLLVGWVQLTDDAAARGDAPLPAFVLMVSVAMSVTAVPVLARILADRGMTDSTAGRLALTSSIVIDAAGWLLFTAAVSLGSGDPADVLRCLRALGVGVLCVAVLRWTLRTGAARRLGVRFPAAAAVLLGATALAVAFTVKELGMTSVLGAALVGFAVPGEKAAPWARAVTAVSRTGGVLVPTFFVVSGIHLLEDVSGTTSWTLIAGTVVLGCLGKGAGSYIGARLDGRPPGLAGRIAVLMNTRGLTELIMVQAGYSAGILSAPLALALTAMALVTTAMTGPLMDLFDRKDNARGAAAVPLPTESGAR